MSSRIYALAVTFVVLFAQSAFASGTVRRFALAAGANYGGAGRTPLQYAVTDAEHFVRVLEGMGGVDPADRILLCEPGVQEFCRAIEGLARKVSDCPAESGRTEVVLYYSGHADEKGLRLGEGRLPYRSLRDQMDAIRADVHITVLDACASGAITRLKGGQRQKAFLLDASSDMKGYAFLTSSSEDEAAQESDHIGASFFTHYLVSGMRGAADVSGDGKVTLGEAYQFAFHETLSRTATTRAGAQHPAYDINLAGTGDVVMTDVRQTAAGLVLSEDLNGRFFIRNAARQLVAELYKPAGRQVELGLEPGIYDVHFEREPSLFASTVELVDGQRQVLGAENLDLVEREGTVLRGGPVPRTNSLARRHRIELRAGWNQGGGVVEATQVGGIRTSVDVGDLLVALSYGYWAQENLATTLTFTVLGSKVNTAVGHGTSSDVTSIVSALLGLRYYFPSSTYGQALRPYITAAAGPYIGSTARNETGAQIITDVTTRGAPGGHLGGGVDVPLGRHFMLGVDAGYHLMMDFSEPVGGKENYSGFEVGVGLSWVFGQGVERR